jgi:hypothetical protein
MSIFLFTHPFHLEFRYSIHGWLYGGDSMIEVTVTTTCRLQDLFDKNHPISFESTYIRAHKIPISYSFDQFCRILLRAEASKLCPHLFVFYLLATMMARLPCKLHRKNKFIASRHILAVQKVAILSYIH